VSRLTDINPQAPEARMVPLPSVDWASIGHTAPQKVPIDYKGPDAPLPAADIAVMTWTSAEWSAFDHVFLDSGQEGVTSSVQLVKDWNLYSRDAAGPAEEYAPLWGYYQLVEIADAKGQTKRVLLFKCDAHLAHPPWITGLVQMAKQVLQDSGCGWIYSIGTAGGSNEDECLGDVSVTDAGQVELKKPENEGGPVKSGTSVAAKSFPPTDLFGPVQPLLFALDQVVTEAELQSALDELHRKDPDSASLSLADLVNAPLDPKNLKTPKLLPTPGKPLLTTDYYFIASGDDAAQYAVLEMDDTIIGYVAEQAGLPFTFVRNISDPIVPATAQGGQPISDTVRGDWSSGIYTKYGVYTSFNGALATWAAIAG
jgi:nucleoside phosphorylase